MTTELTESQKHDLATALQVAWRKYCNLFGEPPHGTLPQMKAFIEFVHIEPLIGGIQNKAITEWYAEGQR